MINEILPNQTQPLSWFSNLQQATTNTDNVYHCLLLRTLLLSRCTQFLYLYSVHSFSRLYSVPIMETSQILRLMRRRKLGRKGRRLLRFRKRFGSVYLSFSVHLNKSTILFTIYVISSVLPYKVKQQ